MSITLEPLVDEFLAAMRALSAAETRTRASYNSAVDKLRARTIVPAEFARLVERDVVAEWAKVRDSMVLVDLAPSRRAAAATVHQYASLRIEGFQAIARSVGTNNLELMKQGEKKQAEALRLMKGFKIPN